MNLKIGDEVHLKSIKSEFFVGKIQAVDSDGLVLVEFRNKTIPYMVSWSTTKWVDPKILSKVYRNEKEMVE